MRQQVFSHRRPTGDRLTEIFEDGRLWLEYEADGKEYRIPLYSDKVEEVRSSPLYLGHTLDEVMASGRDILGEQMLKDGDPDYGAINGILPRITEKAYCFIGGIASHASLMVDPFGVVRNQRSRPTEEGDVLFGPESVKAELVGVKPRQVMADGRMPILINIFELAESVVELIYFVEPGDTDRNPVLWIRVKEYRRGEENKCEIRTMAASFPHEYRGKAIAEELFYDALTDTVACWTEFLESGTHFELPEEELGRVSEGIMTSARTTFTGPRPHYGHKYYGLELHDNFPPNYIWSIEAACLMGQQSWAREIFEHLIRYGLSSEGRFVYRQAMMLGSSAAEYGMMLWLAKRYCGILMPDGADALTRKRLSGTGNVIMAHCMVCPEFDGRVLVKMCAEADNNVRVNVYLNNNLWAIRGLEALGELLGENDGEKYREMAKILRQNIAAVLEKHSVRDERFGVVPPFRFGYPTIPYTLSNCETELLPKSEEERERYFHTVAGRRDFDVTDQEITENTYSNYRYVPESLSAMILSKEMSDGLYAVRRELGGNLLGMVRFRSWLDDWPAACYARFLIETGRVEEYLLLLYSHTKHHGHPELLCYYEQVKLYGAMSANDCVPSLLTTPIMTAWAFAYETVGEGRLRLLSCLPKDWYKKPFAAVGVGCSHGRISVESDGESISVSCGFPIPEGTELVWRAKESVVREDILVGGEAIEKIRGNVLTIKAGIEKFTIRIK